jgi:hypothetical protein
MSSSGYSLTAGWILVIHYIIQLKTFTLSFLQNKKIKLKQVLFCNVISMLQHSDTLPMILIFENTHFWKCDAILEVHIWLGISMSWKANFYCKMLIFVNMSSVHGQVYSIQHYVIQLPVTCGKSLVFFWYSGFLHQ